MERTTRRDEAANPTARRAAAFGTIRPRPALCGIALAAAVIVAGSGVRAESDANSPQNFLHQEIERAGARASPAVRPVIRHGEPRFRRVARQPVEERRIRWVATPVATPAPTTFVAVYGDRIGQALADGLIDNQGPSVGILKATEENGGLTRADFPDWLQSVRARLARPDHASLAVMMVGLNDRGPIADGDAAVEFGTARWLDLYARRIDAAAAVFRDARVPLIWAGLPAVRDDDASADFVRLNGLVRDRAARNGFTYVDCWDGFIDEAGRYSPAGPDLQGQTATLRRADGVGFTHAGARKLASFVEGDIKRLRTPQSGPATSDTARIAIETPREFDAALDIDVNAQIRREAGLDVASAEPDAGRDDTLPRARLAAPEKPAAGAVMALTAPPSSPGGLLAGMAEPLAVASGPSPAGTPGPSPGDSPAPKPGRADDFSWPKP